MNFLNRIEEIQITRRPSRPLFPLPSLMGRKRQPASPSEIARAVVLEVLG
jgi:hypothetical protein